MRPLILALSLSVLPALANETPPLDCAGLRAEMESSLGLALGFRDRGPGELVTVGEGDLRPALCSFQMRATGNEVESVATPDLAALVARLGPAFESLGWASAKPVEPDTPVHSTRAWLQGDWICHVTADMTALVAPDCPEGEPADFVRACGLMPWERAYAMDVACVGPTPRMEAGPSFDDFPAETVVAPEAVAADLDSHPRARLFRTRIEEGAARGMAFAGHLAVTGWQCGSSCQQWVFIDARDGRVTWGPVTSLGARFRPDSRLFVANPSEEQPPGGPFETQATRYYVWNGRNLEPLDGP